MLTAANWQTATYEDVKQYVSAHPYEDQVTEYKGIPEAQEGRGVAKSLSAFANTYGGWLIVGVGGTDGRYRLEGLRRKDHQPNSVTQRIVDSCLGAVWPPLMDIDPREVEAKDESGRFCFIARVGPSTHTPHFLRSFDGKGAGLFECHVRAHGRSYAVPRKNKEGHKQFDAPIDLATDLPNLLNRRSESLQLRARLLQDSRDRCCVWLQQMLAREEGISGTGVFTDFTHWELCICPAFPGPVLASPRDILREHSSRGRELNTIPYFHSGGDPRGAAVDAVDRGARTAWVLFPHETPGSPAHAAVYSRPYIYLELGHRGMVYLRMGIQFEGYFGNPTEPNMLSPTLHFGASWRAFRYASDLYRQSGYFGPLHVAWDVGPSLGTWFLEKHAMADLCTASTWTFSPSDFLMFRDAQQYRADVEQLLKDAAQSLLWAFRVSKETEACAEGIVRAAMMGN